MRSSASLGVLLFFCLASFLAASAEGFLPKERPVLSSLRPRIGVLQTNGDQRATLQQLLTSIKSSGKISAASIGDSLFHQTLPTLGQNDALSVIDINANLTNTVLQVWAKTTIWGTSAQVWLTFFFATPQDAKPQLQIELQLATNSLSKLFSHIRMPSSNKPFPTPSWATELDLSGSIQIVLSTLAYNGFNEGLSIYGTASIASKSSTLLPAFETLRAPSDATKIQLTTNIFVPIFSANPSYLTLSLQESGTFSLSSSIQCTNYSLSLAAQQQSSISLSATLLLSIKSQPQPLNVGVSANWHAGSPTTFTGSLASTWSNAFGLSWLSLSSATVTLVVGPSVAINSVSLAGTAAITFSSQPSTPAQLSASFATNGNYLLSVSGLPIGNALKTLYADVTHQSSPALEGISVTGTASFTVATYNSAPNVKEGFSLTADATLLSSSPLYRAAQTLQQSPSSTTFKLSLYLPIFADGKASSDFDLTVVMSGSSYPLTTFVKVNGYSITLSVSHGAIADVSLTAQLAFSSTSVSLSGEWNAQQSSVSLSGALASAWKNPFGLSWLTLNSGNVAMVIANREITSASVNGAGTLSFSPDTNPANVLFNFKGDGNYAVSVSGLPLSSLGSLYTAVAKKSAPSLLNDLTVKGTLGFTVATYESQQGGAGLTISAQATINSQSSVFFKAAQTLQPSPFTTTYSVTVFAPIFSAKPEDVTIDLSETGGFPLTPSVSINSYSIDVAIDPTSSKVSLNAEVAVLPSHQPQPVIFTSSAEWSESDAAVSFQGVLKSAWNNPLGLSWLTIQSASLSFVLGRSRSVDQIDITTSAKLSFVPSPVTGTVDIKPNGDYRLSVLGIPLTTLVFLYNVLANQDPPEYLWGVVTKSGSFNLTVSTYADASYASGLTVQAQANLLAQQKLAEVARVLTTSPSTKTFQLNFFMPIFSQNPQYFHLMLSESGSFHLVDTISCDSFAVTVDASQDTKFSLSADVSVALAQQPQPVRFSISGQYEGTSAVAFSGTLQSPWQKPFGLDWLQISSASVNVGISGAVVQSLSIDAAGIITLDSSSTHVALSVVTANDFRDFTVSATVDAKWTFHGIAKSIVQKEFAVLEDLAAQANVAFSVILSTYSHDHIKSGVTFDAKGDINGGLLKQVSGLADKNIGSLIFEVSLNIPIFSTNPADVAVALRYDEQVAITPTFFYEGIRFELDTMPLALSVESTFLATFKHNPPLTFAIGAEVKEDGSAIFNGDMIGTWTSVFGFKGFDLSNIIIEFGVNPAMCAVDFCISDLGLGFQMNMGTKKVIFDGNAAAPDFEDLFLHGEVDGSNGMALTMRDVVREWNSIVPELQIPIADVPEGWGLEDVSFTFAPVDGHFGNIDYTAGFAFKGGIRLLDMDLDFAVNCTEKNWDFCNFAVHVGLDWNLFKQMILREIGLMKGPEAAALVVFHIEELSLSEWNAHNYARGIYPYWNIRINVLGKSHLLQFRVQQYELASSFHEFFKKWLAHIFGLNNH